MTAGDQSISTDTSSYPKAVFLLKLLLMLRKENPLPMTFADGNRGCLRSGHRRIGCSAGDKQHVLQYASNRKVTNLRTEMASH